MKAIAVLPVILGLFWKQTVLAQPNPDRPDLRQGKYFTEEEGARRLADTAKTYATRHAWEKRANRIRQGIRAGMELPARPQLLR